MSGPVHGKVYRFAVKDSCGGESIIVNGRYNARTEQFGVSESVRWVNLEDCEGPFEPVHELTPNAKFVARVAAAITASRLEKVVATSQGQPLDLLAARMAIMAMAHPPIFLRGEDAVAWRETIARLLGSES